MRLWAVYRKELRLYFTSPVAYVVVGMFLIIAGVFFYLSIGSFSIYSMQAAMNPAFARDLNVTELVFRPLLSNTFSVVLLLLMPILTMRLFAEEKKSGTIELLLTYPVKDGEVLLGKVFAMLLIFWVLGWSADMVGPFWGKLMSHLSILEHQESFGKGIIDTKDVIYYLDVTIFSLFLTLRSLESR